MARKYDFSLMVGSDSGEDGIPEVFDSYVKICRQAQPD